MASEDGLSTAAGREDTRKRTETPNEPPIANDVDSGSGSENGEKPVREKLKKTELDEEGSSNLNEHAEDSMTTPEDNRTLKAAKKRSLEGKDLLDEPSTPSGIHARKRSRDTRAKEAERHAAGHNVGQEASPDDHPDVTKVDLSGNESDKALHSEGLYTPLSSDDDSQEIVKPARRPAKRRSYDDMDIYTDSDRERRKIAATEQTRARRSSSEGPNDNPENVREKFAEHLRTRKEGFERSSERNGEVSAATSQPPGTENDLQPRLTKKRSREALGEDHEAVRKPTKKRSRDALDEEYERDQKKTSSARQSVDVSSAPAISGKTVEQPQVSSKTTDDPPQTSPSAFAASGFAARTSTVSPFGTIGEKATPSPFGALGASSTSTNPSGDLQSPAETLPKTSSTTFAASGFASMTGSTSPFGAIGSKSSNAFSAFGSAGPSPSKPPSTFASLASSGPNTISPFGKSGTQSSFGALGSGAFGSGIGGLGGGSKLSSFAAPVGDANLGGTTNAKPFGAPAEEDEDEGDEEEDNEEEEGAEGEDRSTEERENMGDGQKEDDTKFLQDDQSRKFKIRDVNETGEEGEECHFQGRGRLYHFVEGQWAEKGSGLIKLNMVFDTGEDEAENTDNENRPGGRDEEMKFEAARLIMRAAATHKVILNARIFKEMRIGDSAGNEPKGKSLMFSVPVEGKLVPHTLKMGQDGATQELFRRVKQLQAEM